MDSLPPRPILLIAIFAFVVCIITSMARKASITVSDAWLSQRAEDGEKKAKRLFNLLQEKSSRIMDGFQVFFVLISFVFCVYTTALICYFADYVGISIYKNSAACVLAVLAGAVITGILYFVFCVIIPERIAARKAEKLSLSLSGYTFFVYIISSPILWVCRILAKIFGSIFGAGEDNLTEEVTEEEIRMMVDIGSESGAIDDDEKQMIHNIFEMDDKPVEEIMTHRTEACILWLEDGLDKWKEFIDETNHTRYPVCGESIDDVIGIVNSRDFYRFMLDGGKDIKAILREVFFIPDTIKADELLSTMQSENEHMGVVMDEYGGFQGLVTQEDLIEEIVGELYSEYDEPEAEEIPIVKLEDGLWQISGSAEIEKVEEELELDIEKGDYNTFAGLILSHLQTIPADGEVFEIEIENMSIKVTSVIDHRIESGIVSILKPEEDEEDDE